VLPGNKKFSEGDILSAFGQGSGRASDPGEVMARCVSVSFSAATSLSDLFLDDLDCGYLAKRKLAEAESEGLRPGRLCRHRSPANISVEPSVRLAMARRVALRRPRRGGDHGTEAEYADCDESRRVELMAEPRCPKAKISPDSLSDRDRHPIPPLRNHA